VAPKTPTTGNRVCWERGDERVGGHGGNLLLLQVAHREAEQKQHRQSENGKPLLTGNGEPLLQSVEPNHGGDEPVEICTTPCPFGEEDTCGGGT
jgi:hypothetical protein